MKFEIAACCETDPDLQSRGIMAVNRAPYSHVLIIVNGKWVYHAVGRGVCREPLEEILKDHHLPHRIELSALIAQADGEMVDPESFALAYLRGSLGIKYGLGQYLGFLFRFLRRFTNNDRQQMVCSEFVADFIEKGLGYEIPADLDHDFVTPAQVVALALQLKRFQ